MSKAKRQMPGQLGRVDVARGEAARDLVSDEVCGPPREHPDTGSAKPKAGRTFGAEWERYASRTPRFIPKLGASGPTQHPA